MNERVSVKEILDFILNVDKGMDDYISYNFADSDDEGRSKAEAKREGIRFIHKKISEKYNVPQFFDKNSIKPNKKIFVRKLNDDMCAFPLEEAKDYLTDVNKGQILEVWKIDPNKSENNAIYSYIKSVGDGNFVRVGPPIIGTEGVIK